MLRLFGLSSCHAGTSGLAGTTNKTLKFSNNTLVCLLERKAFPQLQTYRPSFFYDQYSTTSLDQTQHSDNRHNQIRNIAIIAHVDHGKTTLVDCLLRQSGAIEENTSERVMDSNQMEKERGITILSKVTSLIWNGHQVNIVDTPGHGDFGGEVQRVLNMVDGVLLLVDAAEGPMTQTKYVLGKALQTNLKPIVVLNKMDRKGVRISEVETEIFDLFSSMEASDSQLDYTTVYASAKAGWAKLNPGDPLVEPGMIPLFDAIISHIPPPQIKQQQYFSMLVSSMEHDSFIGWIFTGRVYSGNVDIGDKIYAFNPEGQLIDEGFVTQILAKRGLQREFLDEAIAGDILGIAGLSKATVCSTIASVPNASVLPIPQIDPPILTFTIHPNMSPFKGKDGKLLTPALIRDRLIKEAQTNLSLKLSLQAEDSFFEISGRGELHLSILIETMRREGFEMAISRPKIVYQRDSQGKLLEPLEEVSIEVDEAYSSIISDHMNQRHAEFVSMRHTKSGTTIITYLCTVRSLIGLKSALDNSTRGSATIYHTFHSYVPYKGKIGSNTRGSLISMASGKATAYSLSSIESRGVLYISPQTPIYEGLVIGEHCKESDLEVNPCKEKHLTNVRAANKDDQIKLSPIRPLSLEESLSILQDDELLEVTPKNLRIRKVELNTNKRRALAKKRSGEPE